MCACVLPSPWLTYQLSRRIVVIVVVVVIVIVIVIVIVVVVVVVVVVEVVVVVVEVKKRKKNTYVSQLIGHSVNKTVSRTNMVSQLKQANINYPAASEPCPTGAMQPCTPL